MTDARLRELERRWRETGSLEDEGSFLRERVRAGSLPARTLEILAELGNPGPRAALGLAPVPELPGSETLDVFRERLAETIVWCETRSVKIGPEALRDPALGTTFPLNTREPLARFAWPRSKDMARWLAELTATRRHLLGEEGWIENARAGGLAGGRLLAYSPDVNLADGVAPPVSDGLLDKDNIPAWDTWVWFIHSPTATTLVSWLPPSHVSLADEAVQVNAEECIAWLTPQDLPRGQIAHRARDGQWFSPELEDFVERLDRSGLV